MHLVTSHIEMIKYNDSDFEDFCVVICNDEVMLNISGKGNSIAVAREKFDSILKTNKKNALYGVFKVILLETEAVIGFAKIVPFEEESIEIGYALLPPYWRKGYTIEMIEKMTSHCFEYFPNKKPMAIVNQENIGSVKVLEKCNYIMYDHKDFKGAPCVFFKYIN